MDLFNLPMEHSSLSHMVAIDSGVNAVSLFLRLVLSKTKCSWTRLPNHYILTVLPPNTGFEEALKLQKSYRKNGFLKKINAKFLGIVISNVMTHHTLS